VGVARAVRPGRLCAPPLRPAYSCPHGDNLMKITVHWNGNIADVVFQGDRATIEVLWLNQAERRDLAEHLREIADELSPTTETP